MDNNLEKLVYNALVDKGFDKLPKEEQDKMLPQFVNALEKRIGAAMLPHLSEEAAEEFNNLSSGNPTPEDWFGFWSAHVPDFETKIKEVIAEFLQEINK